MSQRRHSTLLHDQYEPEPGYMGHSCFLPAAKDQATARDNHFSDMIFSPYGSLSWRSLLCPVRYTDTKTMGTKFD